MMEGGLLGQVREILSCLRENRNVVTSMGQRLEDRVSRLEKKVEIAMGRVEGRIAALESLIRGEGEGGGMVAAIREETERTDMETEGSQAYSYSLSDFQSSQGYIDPNDMTVFSVDPMSANNQSHGSLQEEHLPLRCGICNKTFRTASALCAHVEQHGNYRRSAASTPLSSVSNTVRESSPGELRELESRKMMPQNEATPHTCQVCSKSFQNEAHLEMHMEQYHTGNTSEAPKCRVCNKTFRYRSRLITHMRIHTGEKPFRCDFCNRRFGHRSSLKAHLWDVHKKGLPLPSEDKKPVDATGEMFQCQLCPCKYVRKQLLLMHIGKAHPGKMPPKDDGLGAAYRCHVCTSTYTLYANLKRHIKTSHPEEDVAAVHKCNVCQKRFIKIQNLRRHIQLAHRERKPLFCKFCNKKFFLVVHLKRHMKSHNVGGQLVGGSEGYMPDTEEGHALKGFAEESGENAADTVFENATEHHKCHICQKVFRAKHHLELHMVVHSFSRPFSCKVCQRSFKRKNEYVRHKRSFCKGHKGVVVKQSPPDDFAAGESSLNAISLAEVTMGEAALNDTPMNDITVDENAVNVNVFEDCDIFASTLDGRGGVIKTENTADDGLKDASAPDENAGELQPEESQAPEV